MQLPREGVGVAAIIADRTPALRRLAARALQIRRTSPLSPKTRVGGSLDFCTRRFRQSALRLSRVVLSISAAVADGLCWIAPDKRKFEHR
jgi:hypothetical protein